MMQRGDLVTVALQGDYGKPRPALVSQADAFEQLTSTVILPLTSFLQDAPLLRFQIEPNLQNGLQKTSQVMIDKITTLPNDKIGAAFGHVTREELLEITRRLAAILGIG